ncbi:MAG: T9SS C-terminal target domain-containing protein [Candidatus Zixiibacteriota bacterium]|nr:MAG: T9SS C-terminal target domain-containing protein [candidate division Zixibacteria bacterium]
MRRKIHGTLRIALVIVALAAVKSGAQAPDTLWTKTYHFPGMVHEDGSYLIQNCEGNFVIAGNVSPGIGWDVFLMKASGAVGEPLWTEFFTGEYYNANSVCQTSNGGYAVTGNYSINGSLDVFLLKTTPLGVQEWTKTYGGDEWDEGFSVQEVDSGFMIAGRTDSYGAGGPDMWLIRTDAEGDCTWSTQFGGAGGEVCYSAQPTADGGYIMTGWVSVAGSHDVWLVKTDAHGAMEWDTTFGGPGYEDGFCVKQTQDGGYIVAALTYSFGADSGDAWLIKVNSVGTWEWENRYGDTAYDCGSYVIQTSDGGYLFAVVTTSNSSGGKDIRLYKTNAYGDILWTETYGGPYDEGGGRLVQTLDGGYAVLANTKSYAVNPDYFDVWLIRLEGDAPAMVTDPDILIFGQVGVGQQETLTLTLGNPGQGPLWIYDAVSTHPAFTTDLDSLGRLVPAGDSLILTVTFAPDSAGIYMEFLTLYSNADTAHVFLVGEGPLAAGASDPQRPRAFALHPPHPNPFNPATAMSFELRAASYVSLRVFDTAGRVVATLVDGWKPAGAHETTFDGAGLASGIYLVRLEAGDFTQIQKLVLLK